jgi:hypothetical protein
MTDAREHDDHEPSPDMSDADVANGEGQSGATQRPVADDPDAPGIGAIGPTMDDPPEPNEPG